MALCWLLNCYFSRIYLTCINHATNKQKSYCVFITHGGIIRHLLTINSKTIIPKQRQYNIFNRLQIFTSFYFTYSLLWSYERKGGMGGAVNCEIYYCICFMICLCLFSVLLDLFRENLSYLYYCFFSINSAFHCLSVRKISLVILGDTCNIHQEPAFFFNYQHKHMIFLSKKNWALLSFKVQNYDDGDN